MRPVRRGSPAVPALLFTLALALGAACGRAALPPEPPDPLAAEIERWSAYLAGGTAPADIAQGSQPILERAREALQGGRRLLALHRLAAVRSNLAAAAYMAGRPAAEHKETAAFEAEWTRIGTVLRGDLGALSRAALDGVEPAAVRALGEAALPQIRIYYDASLEYGRNTVPESGLFYLGAAQAQRDFAAFCRTISTPAAGSPPPLRPLGPELDALEAEILAAYRPPASIDRHGEFIGLSATLKEARELDDAGLRYGAFLRYLQTAQRFAPLRPAPPTIEAGALAAKLEKLETRLAEKSVDHSLGRLFLEAAEADLAASLASAAKDPGSPPALAAAIAADVLPRYFAALGPAPRAAPKPAPSVTVTLVRWPYT